MNEITKCFDKEIEIKKIDVGLTNQNFKITTKDKEIYIAKKYSKIVKNNEFLVKDLVKEFDADVYFISAELKITKFINFNPINSENLNHKNIKKMAKLLRNFHDQKKQAKISFDAFETLKNYLNIKKPFIEYKNFDFLIKEAQKISQNRKHILCHNDLVFANFLDTPQKMYLIDWEYAGNNDPLFDVGSFLTENNIYDTKWKDVFLKAYFEDEKIPYQEIEIWNNYQNLMFLGWSNLFYEKTKKQVYLDIAQMFITNLEKKFKKHLVFKHF